MLFGIQNFIRNYAFVPDFRNFKNPVIPLANEDLLTKCRWGTQFKYDNESHDFRRVLSYERFAASLTTVCQVDVNEFAKPEKPGVKTTTPTKPLLFAHPIRIQDTAILSRMANTLVVGKMVGQSE